MSVHDVFRCCEVRIEEFDPQLPQHGTFGEDVFDRFVLLLAERTCWSDFPVNLAEMIIETSVTSQNLSGRTQVSLTKPGQFLAKSIPPHGAEHLGRTDFEGPAPLSYGFPP